jgi:hypothetical protein
MGVAADDQRLAHGLQRLEEHRIRCHRPRGRQVPADVGEHGDEVSDLRRAGAVAAVLARRDGLKGSSDESASRDRSHERQNQCER